MPCLHAPTLSYISCFFYIAVFFLGLLLQSLSSPVLRSFLPNFLSQFLCLNRLTLLNAVDAQTQVRCDSPFFLFFLQLLPLLVSLSSHLLTASISSPLSSTSISVPLFPSMAPAPAPSRTRSPVPSTLVAASHVLFAL